MQGHGGASGDSAQVALWLLLGASGFGPSSSWAALGRFWLRLWLPPKLLLSGAWAPLASAQIALVPHLSNGWSRGVFLFIRMLWYRLEF